MERFWNTVYYFAYKLNYKLNCCFYKYSGLIKIYELPFAKKHFKKMKIDNPIENLLDAWKRPDIGLSSIFAGGLMYGLPVIFFSGLHFFYMSFIEKPKRFEYFKFMFLIYIFISFFFTYIFIFHKDKYIKYFKMFEKRSRQWKIKWAWICLGIILLPFIVLIGSFISLTK
jgi:hypothetical protein